MSRPSFLQLNHSWNADPNVPCTEARALGSRVQLRFYLNYYIYEADEDEVGILSFQGCSAWRLGGTNDEGWYLGQCRYSKIAPVWGEFYELVGDDDRRKPPLGWRPLAGKGERHFLFYLRDETFECFADDWLFERERNAVDIIERDAADIIVSR